MIKERTVEASTVASVLLVEDEPVSRMHLSQFLSDEGYYVDSAGSGQEALKLLESKSFDVVMTDFRLKDQINGIDVLTEFQRISPGKGKLLITAYPLQEVRTESIGALYIPKPIDLDDLLLKLKTVLS